jgi:parvulin-like peptidyl-prolyl isomerase
LLRFGKDVLDIEISHLLLQQATAQAKLQIGQHDLDAEIANGARLAQFIDTTTGQPNVKEFVDTVLNEQEITYPVYLRDVVWPSAALKKLTAATIAVSEEDLTKGYEANYCERVRCRAIVLNTMRQAQDVWNKARQNNTPENFGDLATEFSIEPQSKALRGEVPPIGRHGGPPQLEKVAFDLQPGELSGVVQLGNQFVILRCEGRTEPVDVNMAAVREILYQDIYEKKLQLAMSQKFDQIRESARIDNYLAGTSQAPAKAKAGDPVAGGARVDSAVRPAGGGAR